MPFIYHITYRSHWNFAKLRDLYQTDSLETEGFIHCSDKKQILEVANAAFTGEKDLLILVIDTELLKAELRYEGTGSAGQYPHLYGPLNLDAVTQVLEFRTDAKGKFSLPKNLP
ncbi:MAG: DUF952 domain-containing protein [Trueperaceae bacterium]|nr:DUF952 domain-containing protein [Trueperaceae bacterium]